jgi:trans-aconitate 2-methyltransferase
MKSEVSVQRISRLSVHHYQERPASDILCRIHGEAPRRIADLRSEPRSTKALLARRFPEAEVESLEPSQAEGGASPRSGDEFDLIHSDVDLELLPSLGRFLPVLLAHLRPAGHLAAHFPNNLYEPNRALARMVAADGPWAKTLLPVAKTRPFNATMEDLYDLLVPLCASVEIWETTYLFALTGVEAIVDFMKASTLAPFLAPLDARSRRQFLERYLAELKQAYPVEPNGAVLLRHPRMFVLAER